VTNDDGDDTYQSFACVACTRVHLVNLKTGKVLGQEEDYTRRRSPCVSFFSEHLG